MWTALVAVLVLRDLSLYKVYIVYKYIYITSIYFNPHYFIMYGAPLRHTTMSLETKYHFIFKALLDFLQLWWKKMVCSYH